MKISYYLNPERKKNLYCRISDGTERVTFSLEQKIDVKEWDSEQEKLSIENEHWFTLKQFKEYLNKRYIELKAENKSEILARLKTEARTFLSGGSGLDGISRQMFDYFHKDTDLPKYDEFIAAFEKHSGLKKGDYRVETMDASILFHTKNETYVIDTYEGKSLALKSVFEHKSYEEICLNGDVGIWNEIYIDPGIEKSKFIPNMMHEWEIYWNDIYKDIQERIGKTNHLDSSKETSWRQLLIFSESYEISGDMIEMAYRLDDMILYPLAVLTMMHIYDADTCISEYCEHEFFGSGDWECIEGDEENDNSPTFFIKPYEF